MTTPTSSKPDFYWTGTNTSYTATPAQRTAIRTEIAGLRWHRPGPGGLVELPWTPMETLKHIIKENDIGQYVTGLAVGRNGLRYPDGPETATFSLLAIECTMPEGVANLYWIDGFDVVQVASDFSNPQVKDRFFDQAQESGLVFNLASDGSVAFG